MTPDEAHDRCCPRGEFCSAYQPSAVTRYQLSPGRVHGARNILTQRGLRARAAAKAAQMRGEVEFAASLRGKARAYEEASCLLGQLEYNRALPPQRREASRNNEQDEELT